MFCVTYFKDIRAYPNHTPNVGNITNCNIPSCTAASCQSSWLQVPGKVTVTKIRLLPQKLTIISYFIAGIHRTTVCIVRRLDTGRADVYFKFNSILQETEAIRSISTWICLIYTTASIKLQDWLLAKTEVMDKQYFRFFHSIHISNRLPIQLRTAERSLSILPLLYPVCSLYRILRGDIK